MLVSLSSFFIDYQKKPLIFLITRMIFFLSLTAHFTTSCCWHARRGWAGRRRSCWGWGRAGPPPATWTTTRPPPPDTPEQNTFNPHRRKEKKTISIMQDWIPELIKRHRLFKTENSFRNNNKEKGKNSCSNLKVKKIGTGSYKFCCTLFN